jgi:hypothetical protein
MQGTIFELDNGFLIFNYDNNPKSIEEQLAVLRCINTSQDGISIKEQK